MFGKQLQAGQAEVRVGGIHDGAHRVLGGRSHAVEAIVGAALRERHGELPRHANRDFRCGVRGEEVPEQLGRVERLFFKQLGQHGRGVVAAPVHQALNQRLQFETRSLIQGRRAQRLGDQLALLGRHLRHVDLQEA